MAEKDGKDDKTDNKTITVETALKQNIGKSFGLRLADYFVELSNHTILASKHDRIVKFKSRKTGEQCTNLNEFFKDIQKALNVFADFLSTVRSDDDTRKTLAELYSDDIRNVVQSVVTKQHLFDNGTPISRGLAKFDAIASTVSVDRLETLDVSISRQEDADTTPAEALGAFTLFKKEMMYVLCPKVSHVLGKLGGIIANLTFNDIVRFVEEHNDIRSGDLPGSPFRALLADVNIRILEFNSDDGHQIIPGRNNSSAAAAGSLSAKFGEDDKRVLLKALASLKDHKPLSAQVLPDREDKAADIKLLPQSLHSLPLGPAELLSLANFINSMLSLEKRGVFSPGFFKSACVIIAQCLAGASTLETSAGDTASRIKAISTLARKNLIGLGLLNEKNKRNAACKRRKHSSGEGDDDGTREKESSAKADGSSEEDAAGSSASDNDDFSGKKTARDVSSLSSVDFFSDKSIMGSKLRSLLNDNDYMGLVGYINSILDAPQDEPDVSNTVLKKLVASLVDVLVLTAEERDRLRTTLKQQRRDKNEDNKKEPLANRILRFKRDMFTPASEKTDAALFFMDVLDPHFVHKYGSYVFREKLVPSLDSSDSEGMVLSLIHRSDTAAAATTATLGAITGGSEESSFICSSSQKPDLWKLFATLLNTVSATLFSFLKVTSATNNVSPDTFRSVQSRLDSSSSRVLSKFVASYTTMNDIQTKITAVVKVSPGGVPNVLYSTATDKDETNPLKFQKLVSDVSSHQSVKTLLNNSSDLSRYDAASAFSVLLVCGDHSSASSINDDEKTVLSNTSTGIQTIVDAAVAVVPVAEGPTAKYAVVVDTTLLDSLLDFLADTLDSAISAHYANTVSTNAVIESARVLGRLSTTASADEQKCPQPNTIVDRKIIQNLSSSFLKNTGSDEKRRRRRNAEEINAETGLIDAVSSRPGNVARSQLANAIGLAFAVAAGKKIQEAEEVAVSVAASNGSRLAATAIPKSMIAPEKDRRTRTGLMRTIEHLVVFTGVLASYDMFRLSNRYFFSILKSAGIDRYLTPPVDKDASSKQALKQKQASLFQTTLQKSMLGLPDPAKTNDTVPLLGEKEDILRQLDKMLL